MSFTAFESNAAEPLWCPSYRGDPAHCAEMELGVGNEKLWTAADFHLQPTSTISPSFSVWLSLSLPPCSLKMDQWVQMRWTTAISVYLALIMCINHPAGSTLHSLSRCIHSVACWCPVSCSDQSKFPPTNGDCLRICSRSMFTAVKYLSAGFSSKALNQQQAKSLRALWLEKWFHNGSQSLSFVQTGKAYIIVKNELFRL